MRLLIALFVLSLSAPVSARSEIDRGVRDAFLFAFPVYQIARTRAEAITTTRAAGREVVDCFRHRARLAGPQDRAVTTPNNDTLYSSAWLDLANGSVELTIPPLPTRYHSVALMDVFTDNFAVLGTRANGGRGGTFLIVGPAWRGRIPAGMRIIRAPTNDVWVLGRVLVDGTADLPAAAAAQAGFTLRPLLADKPKLPTPTPLPRAPDPRALLAGASALLARGPLPAARLKRAVVLASYGIATDGRDHWDALAPAVRESWARQLPALLAELRAGFGAVGIIRAGWSYPRSGMGRFGGDDFYRAAVALGGLAALPAEEAIYLTAITDADGAPLDGTRDYRLTIPAALPLNGFWSLSMYEMAPDGRLFFTANAMDRYAIGDRTTGIVRNDDGSVTIAIQAHRPNEAQVANWLPTPPGLFRLIFRAYLPKRSLRIGELRLPGVSSAKVYNLRKLPPTKQLFWRRNGPVIVGVHSD